VNVYVYFIKTHTKPGYMNELVKIGKSNDPYERLSQLQIGSPVKLRMMAIVECEGDDDAFRVEKLAHELFERQHKQGEWFMLGTRREKLLRKLAKRVAERRGTALPVNRSPG
jgi:hypothetical protein